MDRAQILRCVENPVRSHNGKAVVFFFHIQLSPTAGTFTSGVSYAARTFLSCSAEHQRQTGTLLSGCEGTNKYSIKQ